jgi:hypothetical protein
MNSVKCKLICCDVFLREACYYIADSPLVIYPEFTDLGSHEQSGVLRAVIQAKIDEAEGKDFSRILLGYGLCGNALSGIEARSVPLVIPRAHDCCTILLGSRSRFCELFGENLSGQWSSLGYLERGSSYIHKTDTGKLLGLDKSYEDFVKEYGEENAQYLWDTLHPADKESELTFIETPETEALGAARSFEKIAAEDGKTVTRIRGDLSILKGLIHGMWNEDEYLLVKPGQRIEGVYDQRTIVTAKEPIQP